MTSKKSIFETDRCEKVKKR